jgi:hypothetical protein
MGQFKIKMAKIDYFLTSQYGGGMSGFYLFGGTGLL